jgi:hypothetical protein
VFAVAVPETRKIFLQRICHTPGKSREESFGVPFSFPVQGEGDEVGVIENANYEVEMEWMEEGCRRWTFNGISSE